MRSEGRHRRERTHLALQRMQSRWRRTNEPSRHLRDHLNHCGTISVYLRRENRGRPFHLLVVMADDRQDVAKEFQRRTNGRARGVDYHIGPIRFAAERQASAKEDSDPVQDEQQRLARRHPDHVPREPGQEGNPRAQPRRARMPNPAATAPPMRTRRRRSPSLGLFGIGDLPPVQARVRKGGHKNILQGTTNSSPLTIAKRVLEQSSFLCPIQVHRKPGFDPDTDMNHPAPKLESLSFPVFSKPGGEGLSG